MLQPGTMIGPYKVVSALGAGGMGEVYRAHDARLGREVAVKVLPERLSHDTVRLRRFEREARAAAALVHPNVLAIYDVGTNEGQPYIVTELLEGQTLRELIREKLTISKAVELAIEIANGLAAAHERGVVHRDLKPSNVMVTRAGVVKILDFGLAKLTEAAFATGELTEAPTEEPATGTGAAIGTTGYMSPEQVRGKPADHRADIFALGCVMYEMLAGRRPFTADTPADIAAAILSRDPPSLTGAERAIPPTLDRIVQRCLEKRPDDRFQSARDVAFALQAAGSTLRDSAAVRQLERTDRSVAVRVPLKAVAIVVMLLLAAAAVYLVRRWTAVPPMPEVKHVAIMSFTADANEAGLMPIATGLTRVVADGLSLIEQEASGQFWVVPLSEARDRGVKTPQDAYRTFNVTVAVTGRVGRNGNRLHLALAALEPGTGKTLRTAVVEDSTSNVSSFQNGLVQRVARMLDIDVSNDMSKRLTATATTVSQAFQAYLKAVSALSSPKTVNNAKQAVGLLVAATQQDPLFVPARAELGRAYLQLFKTTRHPIWLDRASAEGERMVKGNGRPEGYRLLAAADRAAGHLPEAVTELEHAESLSPSEAALHMELAAAYRAAGRLADAERQYQRTIFLRPGYWPDHNALALFYLHQGRYEAAATQWRQVIACAPQLASGYTNLAVAYYALGRYEETRKALERSIAIEPDQTALANLGTLYFNEARFADAAAMLERATKEPGCTYKTWGNLAFAYKFGVAPEKAEVTFRRAAQLAEAKLAQSPNDLQVSTDLADYDAMLGQPEAGLKLIEPVIAANPEDPQLVADIAECLWDLGDHSRAFEWVHRAFAAGVERGRFEKRPTLRDLVADPRYQRLVEESKNKE
ncbi:MAG: protein kinase [Acidobacteria bacterium]|nr:protein kinase [Acidobacteriota bacterium]